MGLGKEVIRLTVAAGIAAATAAFAVRQSEKPAGREDKQDKQADPATGSDPTQLRLVQAINAAKKAAPPHPDEVQGSKARPISALPPALEELSQEEEVHVAREKIRNYLTSHEQEPREHEWANEQERELFDSLEPVKLMAGVSDARVECRSVSCVATITWRSEGEMRQQFFGLMPATRGIPCAIETVVPEVVDGQAVEQKLYLDCTDKKLGALHDEYE